MIHTTRKNAHHAPAADAALSLSVHAKPKYHLRAGNEYLHWSASKLTSDRRHAWVGTMDQARACRRTFAAAAGLKTRSVSPLPQHAEEAL